MKKVISLLIALIFCMSLAACGTSGSDQTSDKQTGSEETHEKEDNTSSSEISIESSLVTAEDYYRYLNEVFLPEHQLASVEKISTELPKYTRDLRKKGGTGLLSALIDDFDGDGNLEMLTVEVKSVAIQDTFLEMVFFWDGASYDPETRCLELYLRHFTFENGKIEEYGAGTANVLLDGYWGKVVLGVEKVDQDFYVFSKGMSENVFGKYNYDTNLDLYTICRIGGTGISPSYTAPFHFKEAHSSDYLEKMGEENTLDPEELSLSDLEIPEASATNSEILESLGNRLLCVVDVDIPNLDRDELTYQLTDYTQLRENLENNGTNWERIQLPEGYKK